MIRVHNRFDGMRDLACRTFSEVIDSGFELKTGTGGGNFNYKRKQDFVFLWGGNARFARATKRETGFQ